MGRRLAAYAVALIRLLALAAGIAGVSASVASAQNATPPIKVDDAFARAMPPGARTAGAYLAIENRGTQPDRLVSARSPRAAAVELHQTSEQGGVMRMRPVEAVPIAPGQSVKLTPGGLHLMLIDPKPPLKEGEHIPVTLRFERAGDVGVDVTVRSTSAGATAHGH
jgi:copper(I)-binding protein